ncbi:hypothetical protein IKW75_02865 [Candidatus Saccharibacteria bacterium]|nr:hypothetical protein [Candidatus Saccharibacteria bacterium]
MSVDDLKEWASDDADLSDQFKNGEVVGNSESRQGAKRKQAIVERVELAFSRRASTTVYGEYCKTYRELFEKKLEDPGLLHNFEYFNIPSSDFMLMFYASMWTGKMADAMIYLHNYGWDLKGNFCEIPPDDVWFQMSFYEAMNINERIKAQSVVDKIDAIVAKKAFAVGDWRVEVRVTAFGGGNLPERLYRTSDGRGTYWVGMPVEEPEDLFITVFDHGEVRPLAELYNADNIAAVDYIHDSFMNAPKNEMLLGTQDLVWMHGLSMYLGPRVPDALHAGFELLVDGGEMMYDYLIMTESLRRCLSTQGWPVDSSEMYIQPDVDSAYRQAQKDVAALNLRFHGGKSLFEIEKLEITEIYPWGAPSLRVTLKKYSSM